MKKLIFIPLALLIFVIAQSQSLPQKANRYFSPNIDGVKDTFEIPLKIKDNGSLYKWIVEIYSAPQESAKIRKYESVAANEIYSMNAQKFMKRIIQKKEPIVIPEFVAWDGRSEITKNNVVVSELMKDGVYFFRIIAEDDAGNIATSPFISFVLDTVRPEVTSLPEGRIFSPNGDGRKDTLSIALSQKNLMPLDSVLIEVTSQEGLTKNKRTYPLSGERLLASPKIVWEGLDDNKKEMPEGNYIVTVYSSDLAGNQFKTTSDPIKLVRTIEKVSLLSSTKIFSPDNNGYYDTLTFDQSVTSIEDLDKWTLNIFNSKKEIARTFSGTKSLQNIITFDGAGNNKTVLPDGKYEATLTLEYFSGNNPSSAPIGLEIDNTAPALSVKTDYDSFVPNSSNVGARRTLPIQYTTSGKATDNYSLVIYDELEAIVYKNDFSGNVASTFAWDGKNLEGRVVGGKYNIVLMGQDEVGNKSSAKTGDVKLITEGVKVDIVSDLLFFSPNGDGVKDSVNFQVTATRPESIVSQIIRITDAQKKMIREFSTAYTEKISWDGKSTSGAVGNDGQYFYTLILQYKEETIESAGRFVWLDNTPVKLNLSMIGRVFSPNDDGRLDTMTFEQTKIPSEIGDADDQFAMQIKSTNNIIYRQQEWKGVPPKTVRWTGSDQNRVAAPEGVYIYEITTVDAAGNKSKFATEPFELVRKMASVDFTISGQYLSLYPKNQSHTQIQIVPAISEIKFFEKYRVSLLSPQGEMISLAEVSDSKKTYTWTGKDIKNGNILEGAYNVVISALYESGNQPSSPLKQILFDSTPPAIRVNTTPEYFSPDGNGIDDELSIGVKVDDQNEVKSVELFVYRLEEFDSKMKPFVQTLENYQIIGSPLVKKWSFNGAVDTIIKWDGMGENGYMVESANEYILFVKAADSAGNIHVENKNILVDVLVVDIPPDRKKIIINSIYFETGSAKLVGNFERTLDRLVSILNKFPTYNIEIIGHTDARGDENFNNKLSENRARSVFQYLVKKDIDRKRLTATGKGESELINTQATTDEEHRVNRRVEFFLIKQ